MAKLYYYYSSMNAGKSTDLLQSNFNYRERGMNTMLFTSILDNRYNIGDITSRIGIKAEANTFDNKTDLFEVVNNKNTMSPIHCVLIDEVQWLVRDQVFQLAQICDQLNIPVLAYGLRSDFKAKLFEGSQHLLAIADEINEIRTVCFCGKKATMNMRIDENGNTVHDGDQIAVGGNESYITLCRKHFMERSKL